MSRVTLISFYRRFCFFSPLPAASSYPSISLHNSSPESQKIESYIPSQNPFKESSSQSLLSLSTDPSCSLLPIEDIRDSLVHRYRHSNNQKEALQLHLHVVKHGFDEDLFLCNTLLSIYSRTGDLESARKVFDEIPERNVVSWACLISGCKQNGMPEEAGILFRDMICAGLTPNHYAFGSALRACQELGPHGLTFGTQIHGLVSKMHFQFESSVGNALVSMYGQCQQASDSARKVFDDIQDKSLISWNSIISVCAQRGQIDAVFELFIDMQHDCLDSACKPNEFTFGSLITAASSSTSSGLCLFEQMLSMVMKSGFQGDLYVGSALVSGFAKFGYIDGAIKIFEQMSVRNAVSMNGLMVGLVKQKRGEEAAKIFKEMKNLVEINLDSYVVLLSSFPEFVVPEDGMRIGKEVHAYVLRTGFLDVKIPIANGLINMYAKCGSVDCAASVFELMQDRDSVSWNTLISGLDQNECYEEAVANLCRMRRTGLTPSNFSLISSLSSCASLGWIRLGTQVHSETLKLGLDLDVSVANALLALYTQAGTHIECQKFFTSMPEYDEVSWNSVIGALADSEESALEAVMYFLKMMRMGWDPNRICFINILSAASSLSDYELSPQIHALALKHRVAEDTVIENALISCYGKCKKMEDCEKIFSRMLKRRDEISWNSMISGYIHNELLSKAMDLVWLMMQNGRRLDQFTFSTVLSACASVATLERGMEVHACELRACLESDVVVGTSIVDMYAKCGRIDYASRFFERMPVKNVYSWNSMISGYARHGHVEKALVLFQSMKTSGQQPDDVTFVGVLSACSHAGLVEEGYKHFEAMDQKYGLTPRMEHCSCMVDLFGRAGKLDNMEDFINKMPMKPNILIWRTVLGSCVRTKGRNTELGRKAAKVLLELEPENAVNYVLLSNMYATGEKWDNVIEARSAMRSAATKKDAGSSWVTMKDGVHVFVAGDKSHPEKEAIYAKLKELQVKMRDLGYIPETSYALYDLEEETKEELLSYHSEKLAVAFVLTRRYVSTIRIMKNLRVCGDCHSAFKYISEIVDREIVLRDSNRFHHFANGACSCGDYW